MKLIIQPDDGVTPLLSAIKDAKTSVEIAVFRFDRRDLEVALKAAAARGVRVTALIAFANRGGEKNLRKLELSFLDAGIIVARSSEDLIRYHDKFILIDRRILFVLSFNFTHLDIDHSRGFGIVSTNASWAREATKLFKSDCTRTPYMPEAQSFVVSPANSRKVLGTFLKRAKKQLLIYDPKISDKEMLRILQERAKAGVEIRIIGSMVGRAQFPTQKLAGGHRLHTRTIIRDLRQAFVGSQSLRPAELDSRRELGLIIDDAKCVKKLIAAFESDWSYKGAMIKSATSNELETAKDAAGLAAEEQTAKAVQVLEKELDPLAATVKKAVRKAVAKAGEEVLNDKEVKDMVKNVVKNAVKEAVRMSPEISQGTENES